MCVRTSRGRLPLTEPNQASYNWKASAVPEMSRPTFAMSEKSKVVSRVSKPTAPAAVSVERYSLTDRGPVTARPPLSHHLPSRSRRPDANSRRSFTSADVTTPLGGSHRYTSETGLLPVHQSV